MRPWRVGESHREATGGAFKRANHRGRRNYVPRRVKPGVPSFARRPTTRVVDRWVGLEMQARPFDKEVLRRLTDLASEEAQARLRLSITLRFHPDLENQATGEDELAAGVLRRSCQGERAYPFREERAWYPYLLGWEFLRQCPAAVQRLLIP